MARKKTGFALESAYHGKTHDWITPKYIIDAFGIGWFDLDPCASVTQPWSCARKAFTVEQDGLSFPWWGNVWLNPPYGPHTPKWIRSLIDHGEGVALIFSRTEKDLWQKYIFPTADGYLFIDGRVRFCHPDGVPGYADAGSGSCLIAWGQSNRDKLVSICNEGLIEGTLFDRPYHSRLHRFFEIQKPVAQP
jgi:hypothetical protein